MKIRYAQAKNRHNGQNLKFMDQGRRLRLGEICYKSKLPVATCSLFDVSSTIVFNEKRILAVVSHFLTLHSDLLCS